MSLRGHGNWCGPGWTAGQYKNAKDMEPSDFDVPAIDDLDQLCKEHDIALHDAESPDDVSNANRVFIERAKEQGFKGNVFSQLVEWFGPETPARYASLFNLPSSTHASN